MCPNKKNNNEVKNNNNEVKNNFFQLGEKSSSLSKTSIVKRKL